MGLADFLLPTLAGAGRGYRASEEIKRQLAEAKINQMMKERELALRERDAALQERLGSAQIENLGLQGQRLKEGVQSDAQARERASAPILPMPPGVNGPQSPTYDLNIGGNRLSIPNQMGSLHDIESLLGTQLTGEYGLKRQSLENAGDLGKIKEEAMYRINHPEVYGGNRVPKTRDELKADFEKTMYAKAFQSMALTENAPDYLNRVQSLAKFVKTLSEQVFPEDTTSVEPNPTTNSKTKGKNKKVSDPLGIR